MCVSPSVAVKLDSSPTMTRRSVLRWRRSSSRMAWYDDEIIVMAPNRGGNLIASNNRCQRPNRRYLTVFGKYTAAGVGLRRRLSWAVSKRSCAHRQAHHIAIFVVRSSLSLLLRMSIWRRQSPRRACQALTCSIGDTAAAGLSAPMSLPGGEPGRTARRSERTIDTRLMGRFAARACCPNARRASARHSLHLGGTAPACGHKTRSIKRKCPLCGKIARPVNRRTAGRRKPAA